MIRTLTNRTDATLTPATLTPAARTKRLATVAVAALAVLTAAFVAPAAAAPAGPEDIAPEPVPDPDFPAPKPPADPSVTLSAGSTCEPGIEVSYNGQILNGPNRPHVPSVSWTAVGDADGGAAGLAGAFPGVDGASYELQAVVVYPPLPQPGGGGLLPQIVVTSDPVVVTVDCPQDPGGEPGDEDGDDDPNGGGSSGTQVLDEVVDATPNFTG